MKGDERSTCRLRGSNMLKLMDLRLPRNLYLNEGSVPVASLERCGECGDEPRQIPCRLLASIYRFTASRDALTQSRDTRGANPAQVHSSSRNEAQTFIRVKQIETLITSANQSLYTLNSYFAIKRWQRKRYSQSIHQIEIEIEKLKKGGLHSIRWCIRC